MLSLTSLSLMPYETGSPSPPSAKCSILYPCVTLRLEPFLRYLPSHDFSAPAPQLRATARLATVVLTLVAVLTPVAA